MNRKDEPVIKVNTETAFRGMKVDQDAHVKSIGTRCGYYKTHKQVQEVKAESVTITNYKVKISTKIIKGREVIKAKPSKKDSNILQGIKGFSG